jgi:ubiquinone/menaquinone biosynthesis C-methylase UbiE
MQTEGIHITPAVTGNAVNPLFEERYIALRSKEQWLSSDEELAVLPAVSPSHPHYREWNIRQRSAQKLVQYLQIKQTPLRILEAGCGNGWLAHLLAGVPGCTVTGIDINNTELLQAKRVFGKQANLIFSTGDIRQGIVKKARYDIIIFAASIQYFQWLGEIVHAAFDVLAPGGEVHILDSPVYYPGEKKEAEDRSAAYFRQQGFPEMTEHYFHHTKNELGPFNYKYLYNPYSWKQQLLPALITGPKNPFPWICITDV